MKRATKNRWISIRPSDLDRLRTHVPIDFVVDASTPPKPGMLRVIVRRREGCKRPAFHLRSDDLADVYCRTARLLLGPYRRDP